MDSKLALYKQFLALAKFLPLSEGWEIDVGNHASHPGRFRGGTVPTRKALSARKEHATGDI